VKPILAYGYFAGYFYAPPFQNQPMSGQVSNKVSEGTSKVAGIVSCY
jgi:hypothetical protein